MDLGPTILELAEVDPPESMEAKSLLPILEKKEDKLRDYVFAEHIRDGILQETEFLMMVRSEEWKLVNFIDLPGGQLFDLKKDPNEQINLWDEPAFQEQKDQLLDIQRRWLIESNIQTGSWQEDWR